MVQMAHKIQSGSKQSATGDSRRIVMKKLQAVMHGTKASKLVLYTKRSASKDLSGLHYPKVKQVVQNSKRHSLPSTDTTLLRLVLCYGESSTLLCTGFCLVTVTSP